MLRHLIQAIAGCALLLLAGCGDPRVDGTSDQSMAASLLRMRSALPEGQRAPFDEAIRDISIDSDPAAARLIAAISNAPPDDVVRAAIRIRLDRKTAAVLIAEASKVRSKWTAAAEARAQALAQQHERVRQQEKADLEVKERQSAAREADEVDRFVRDVARAHDVRKQLESLRVEVCERSLLSSSFRRGGDATVRNGLEQPIADIHFFVEIWTPGRASAWAHGEHLADNVEGGLEPGESRRFGSVGWELDREDDHPEAVIVAVPRWVRFKNGSTIDGRISGENSDTLAQAMTAKGDPRAAIVVRQLQELAKQQQTERDRQARAELALLRDRQAKAPAGNKRPFADEERKRLALLEGVLP
ncbi:MAG: DUF6694 family lipoprotein [Phycisphaerales bacterium]